MKMLDIFKYGRKSETEGVRERGRRNSLKNPVGPRDQSFPNRLCLIFYFLLKASATVSAEEEKAINLRSTSCWQYK